MGSRSGTRVNYVRLGWPKGEITLSHLPSLVKRLSH